jgi:hypothetical protein
VNRVCHLGDRRHVLEDRHTRRRRVNRNGRDSLSVAPNDGGGILRSRARNRDERECRRSATP